LNSVAPTVPTLRGGCFLTIDMVRS
jgi:hypothetical protein